MPRFSRTRLGAVGICAWLTTMIGCDGTPSELSDPSESSTVEDDPSEQPALREGWPTEAEAMATILKVERSIRASESNREIWHITDLRHEVQSVQFAERTVQKWMETGSEDVTTYPAHQLHADHRIQ